MSNLPPHELYAQKQLRHGLGYALFNPDPCGIYDRVRVGDVGYILNGKFARLFNAFHEANDPVNRGAMLPDNFVPIGEKFRALDVIPSLPVGLMTSESDRAFRDEGTLFASGPNAPVSSGMDMKRGSRSSGAALLMNYSANCEKALSDKSDKAMEDYIVANHASWLDMVQKHGRSVHLNDFIFVRDCTLTGDWTTLVWDEVSFSSESSPSIGTASVADASISIWDAWEDKASAPKLQGPVRTDHNRAAYARCEFDQCIFLKGLRVSRREWYGKLLSIVRAQNKRQGIFVIDPPGPAVSIYLTRFGFNFEAIGNTSSTFRPVQDCHDLLAIFIFENSDADIALVDDNDLNVFNSDQMGSLETMCNVLLNKANMKVVISASEEERKEKVGRISWRDPEPSVFSEQDIIVIDESYQPLLNNDEMQVGRSDSMRESSGSQGGSSSSDDRAVTHTCEGNPDECSRCLATALLGENQGLTAGLIEALEGLFARDTLDELAQVLAQPDHQQ